MALSSRALSGRAITLYKILLWAHILCHQHAQGLSSSKSTPEIVPQQKTPTDPCALLQTKLQNFTASVAARTGAKPAFAFARPSDVIGCTRSVPFVPTRDLGTLASIIKLFLSFYSLLHIAKRTPDARIPSSFDVVSELQKLQGQNWTSAESFYANVSQVIDRLDDGHTGVDLGCPPFLHRLALPLVGVVESGKQVVRTAPTTLLIPDVSQASMLPPFKFNPALFTSARVTKIEGQPAWQFMQSWAQESAGGFHDPGQKLNLAFAHLKWLNGTRARSYGAFGNRMHNPGQDSIQLTIIRNGRTTAETIAVPWLSYTPAFSLGAFNSTATYFAAFCKPQGTAGTGKGPVMADAAAQGIEGDAKSQGIEGVEQEVARERNPSPEFSGSKKLNLEKIELKTAKEVMEHLQKVGPGRSAYQQALVSGVTPRMARGRGKPEKFVVKAGGGVAVQLKKAQVVSTSEDYWKVYKLSDNKTCVVSLNNFLPLVPSRNAAEFARVLSFYAYESAKALYRADDACGRLILDLSTNGGGATILIPWLLELIQGSSRFPKPRSQMQNAIQFMADTPLVQRLRDKALGSYNWRLWATSNELPFNSTTRGSFFYPLKQRKFGVRGDVGKYSSFFKEVNPSLKEWYRMVFPRAFGNKPVLLFSDGLCYSACSTFATMMKLKFGAKLVSIGGVKSKAMAFSSAGGGFVSEDVQADIIDTFTPDVAKLADAPKSFGLNMRMTMRWTNGFLSDSSSLPIEFNYVAADHMIDYTIDNIVDPSLQYSAAAAFF